jgi:hypothetical protein
MANYAYPIILKENYGGFRQILPDLPESYEKWRNDVEARKAKDRLAHEAAAGSFESRDVRVNGGKFLGYCNGRGSPPSLFLLDQFVNDSTIDHG